MLDAARRLDLSDGSSRVVAGDTAASAAASAWSQHAERLELVLDAARFESMLTEATRWAERITLCVTAPQSQRSSSPSVGSRGGSGRAWWGELLARSTKCDRIYVRRPDQTESWLLHRLHDTGALRWLSGGGKQVASNLLMFWRDGEARVLLSHIPLERAVLGAGFGALLSFRGAESGELVRSCLAQAESWAAHACIPTGSDVDALALERRRAEPLVRAPLPSAPYHVVSEPEELRAELARFTAQSDLTVRPCAGGYQIVFPPTAPERMPFVASLQAGAGWASGDALLLRCGDGEAVLVWRGGLLGHSPARGQLLWAAARLQPLVLDDATLGRAERVAVVAHTAAPLGPQLTAFARELARLGEMFGVESAPALGNALADFESLSSKQQTLLLRRALLGLGALDFGVATLTAAAVLRDQGYLRCAGLKPQTPAYRTIAELLARAAESGAGFDRPEQGKIRAIQPERAAYLREDWLECLLLALPEDQAVSRGRAARLAFERARRYWGLSGEWLRRGHALERTLESTVSHALRRGFLVRVGAGALRRVSPGASEPELGAPAAEMTAAAGLASSNGFAADWFRQLERLSPAQRAISLSRAGWYGQRESLESVAQRLGVSLERARQLEAEAWRSIEQESSWVSLVRTRLTRALADARAVPLAMLLKDDAWWRGADQHLGLAQAAFESVLGGELHCFELKPRGFASADAGEAFFARFAEPEVDAVVASLRARAALVPTPAALDDYEPLLAAAAEQLDPCLEEYLREELEALLVLSGEDPARVESMVVPGSCSPLELSIESSVDSERRLRLEDAARSAFRSAGTPLSLAGVTERVNQRIDADEGALAALLCRAPFVQRNADQYGLLARDVPGGPDAIASAINTVADVLETNQRSLAARQAFVIVQARIKQSWSYELLCSLLRSDPALSVSAADDLTLRRWGQAQQDASNLCCPGVPPRARACFTALRRQPPGSGKDLARRVRSVLSGLERSEGSDDLSVLALARQLGDVYERLLDYAESRSPGEQQLAHAAVRFFIEAPGIDDEAGETTVIDRDHLTDARAVLAAVLEQLESRSSSLRSADEVPPLLRWLG